MSLRFCFQIMTIGLSLSLHKQCRCPTLQLHSNVDVRPDASKLTYRVGERFEIYCYISRYMVPTGLPATVVQCQDNCTWSQNISHIECFGEDTSFRNLYDGCGIELTCAASLKFNETNWKHDKSSFQNSAV